MSEPNAGTGEIYTFMKFSRIDLTYRTELFFLAKDVLGMKSNAVYDFSRDGYVLNGAKVRLSLSSFINIGYVYCVSPSPRLCCDGRCGLPMGH